MATLKDVAHALNISYSTVSAIMRGRGRELRFSEETCALVESKAQELGYRPNLAARALRAGRSYLIGVLVSNINHNVIVPGLLQGLDRVLIKHHMGMLVATYQTVAELNERVELMLARNVDGVILLPDGRPEFEIARKKLLQDRFAVGLGMDSKEYDIPWVFTDPVAAAEITVDYLLKLGHRNFAKVIRRSIYDDAAEKMIKAAGGKLYFVDPEQGATPWIAEERIRCGQNALRMIVEQRLPVTAILAYNDFVASGVIAAAETMNLKVPDDFSVTGLDGIEISRCVLPKITTAVQPFEQQGCCAGELLMKILNGEKITDNIKLLPMLQIGGSAGPPAANFPGRN